MIPKLLPVEGSIQDWCLASNPNIDISLLIYWKPFSIYLGQITKREPVLVFILVVPRIWKLARVVF